MEKSIRVLVANHPRLMREIVLTTFADQPDIEIVGEVANESEISESVKRTLPNFVVIALDHPGRRPAICDELLREHPEVRIIAVAPEKNCIVYYWASFNIHSNDVEISSRTILTGWRPPLIRFSKSSIKKQV
ncbi:MAG: hypothetical protein DMG54_32525 [Acidobacteria bacterium]|nr:MAG: hypothetical protein DMG54_32525 [Acidobacteriota bacterium]